jgi:hypothetical protein
MGFSVLDFVAGGLFLLVVVGGLIAKDAIFQRAFISRTGHQAPGRFSLGSTSPEIQ